MCVRMCFTTTRNCTFSPSLPLSLSHSLSHFHSAEHVHVYVFLCTDKLLKRALNAEMIKLKRL